MDYNAKCPKLPWMLDFHMNEDGVLNSQYRAAFADNHLGYLSTLNIKSAPFAFRSTRFICTVPSDATTTHRIEEMLSQGVNVAKIAAAETSQLLTDLRKIRAVCDNYSRKIGMLYPLAMAIEIRGPCIQTGKLKEKDKGVFLKQGNIVTITTDKAYEEFVDKEIVFVDYENLPQVVQPGDKLIIDNGSIALSALEVVHSIVRCIVEKAGMLLSKSSVTLPNVPIELPSISSTDKEMIEATQTAGLDFVFISGVQNKDRIAEVKRLYGPENTAIQIVSQIESAVAIECIDEIIKNSDGICVNCDKLIGEIPKEKVFLAQKAIIAKCKLAGKPVISTVQILDSKNVSKSEFSDIAAAVIDGTDAIVIPANACNANSMKSIDKVCREADSAVHQKKIFEELTSSVDTPMESVYSLAIAAVDLAMKSEAAAVICVTSSGRTAKILSRFRPRCIIIAVTRYLHVAKSLGVYRSVKPLVYLKRVTNWNQALDEKIQFAVTYGKYAGHIKMGDVLVVVTPSRPEVGLANSIKVVFASDFDALPKIQSAKDSKAKIAGKTKKKESKMLK